MKKMLILALLFSSFVSYATEKHSHKKKANFPKQQHNPYCIFDVIPLNSPVKDSFARFKILMPVGYDIDEVFYHVRNAGKLFEKVKIHQRAKLISGSEGKELKISISELPPGFYQLFVKVKDKKNKEHHFRTKFKDHAMFVVDRSLQVPAPNPKLNDKTIAGVDSDNDGIRDDIQRWINEEFSTEPKVKMAMREVAISRQLDLLSVDNKEQSILAGKKYLDDLICLSSIVGLDQKSKLRRELDTQLLNTKDRLYANLKANANFSGQAWELPGTDEEKKALCSFNPDNF